jgi:hypothetical protein
MSLLEYRPSLLNVTVAILSQAACSESTLQNTGFAALSEWAQRARGQTSVIALQPNGGLGNHLTAMVSAGILAFYFNKPIHCSDCDGRYYNFKVPADGGRHWSKFPDIPDLYTTDFDREDSRSFDMWFFAPDHLLLHRQIGKVLYDAFGEYAIYFIGNYFFSFPADLKGPVDRLLASIPATVITIGVHVRTHWGLPAFMTDVHGGCGLMAQFIQNHWSQKSYQVFVATDNGQVHTIMREKFPHSLNSGATAMPDGDLSSAATDFYMIQCCQELVLTYRSTFSIMLAALANKTGYYYASEWSTLVRFSCSQLGMASGVYQDDAPFNDKSNTIHHMRDQHEPLIRMYYKYYLV